MPTDTRTPVAPLRRRVTLRAAIAGFAAAAVVHLALHLAGADALVLRVSQATLMPALALWAFAPLPDAAVAHRLPPRVAVPLGVALACSWAGDIAPGILPDEAGFLAMVGAFFVAQLAWLVALWPWRRRSLAVGRTWPFTLAYAAAAVGVLVLTASGAGALLAAIAPYAAALAATALLATALDWRGTLGGLLFMASDAMIAIFTFAPLLDPGEPTRALAIMATYCGAQALLVWGVRCEVARRGPPQTG